MADQTPVFYESFNQCVDDGSNKFVGGNDNNWGGDGVGTSLVIYFDWNDSNNPWEYDNANGAYQCVKVGTSTNGGTITTPKIAYDGDATLTFRAAPWVGYDEDSTITVDIKGGIPLDPTTFELNTKKWNDISIRIADIKDHVQITFAGLKKKKNRFFLDEVKLMPADPTAGAIRTEEGMSLDFGLLGRNYSSTSRTLHVLGSNLSSEGITATLADGTAELFSLSTSQLPAEGGELKVTLKSGADGYFGCNLYLRGKDRKTKQTVERKISITGEVTSLNLIGSGTKEDPYTCADVITLAYNEGTTWTETYYWVTGFVLGGVKRYNDEYDGISMTDNLSLVLADDPNETDESKYVTVQIGANARSALNVVDNPELVGKQIKVNGWLLNENANPWYLAMPGVMNVRTNDQYVRPWNDETGIENGEWRMENGKWTKILRNGQLYIMYEGKMYDVRGIRCK